MVECGPEGRRHVGLARQSTERRGCFVRITLNGEKALDQPTHVARQFGAGAERRLLKEPIGDFGNRASSNSVDTGIEVNP